MRSAFVAALCELAARDERVLLLTADLGFAFLEPFRDRFPARFFNVGVAEDNMIGLATGLAHEGYVPFAYTIAAFALPRTFEVVRNGPVAHRLPVRVVGVGGGFDYGVSGATHWAFEDLALARALGALDIFVPADAAQARAAVFATPARDGPVYLRLENEDRGALPGGTDGMPPGSVTLLRSGGRDALLLALGPAAFDALAAAEALQAAGIGASVAVVASLRPLDTGAVFAALGAAPLLVTLENHAIDGGLGSLMAEAAADAGRPLRLLRTGVTERDFAPGRPGYLRAALGLDGPALARRIAQALRGA